MPAFIHPVTDILNMKKLFLLIALFLFTITAAFTQGLTGTDLRQIKVDQLSDNDIIYYYNRMQQAGVSVDQAAQLAASRGMPQAEIAKLQKRINAILAGQKTKQGTMGAGSAGAMTDSLGRTRMQDDGLIPLLDETVDKKIFGAELFTTASLAFEPNLRIATPGNYQLGPDDELVVNVFGLSEARYDLKVNPEGFVYIQNAGPVMVNGLTVDEAAVKIRSKLSSTIYKAIQSGQTKVQVTLGSIRSIRVTVIGEAKKPGTYTISSLATLFNALYVSGGPSLNGSYRNIELVRNNKVYKTVDLYDFLLKGSLAGNVQLKDEDVIRIPYYKARATLVGEVKRPGIYELKPGENLQMILDNAGGFTDSAYRSSVKITSVTDKQRKVSDVGSDAYSSYAMQGGEMVQVGVLLNTYANRVTIQGAVKRPGQYELTEGLTVMQLIEKCDGLRPDAFLRRGLITRLKEDYSVEAVSFSVENILNGTEPDVVLKREDDVVISSIFDLQDKKFVTIQGAVRREGKFEFKDSMTVKDLVFMAGGFSAASTGKRVEVARRVTDADPNNTATEIARIFQFDTDREFVRDTTQFFLRPFDVVVIRGNPGYFIQKTIRVDGEVLYPGAYVINSADEKLSSIIERAGGFKNTADPSAASLRRVNKIDAQSQIKTEKIEKLVAGAVRDTSLTDSLTQEAVRPYDLIGINLEEVMQKPGITNDLILEDGDIVYVPKKNQAVKVRGEVLFPTQFAYEAGHNMKYYINKAGGYASSAQKRKSFVLGSSGNARTVKKFLFFKNYPDIKAGDEIYVPPKPDTSGKGLSTGEIIALTTATASLASVVIAILNSTQ